MILQLILIILVVNTLFAQLLSWLNLRNHTADLPKELSDSYDPEAYAKSYDYHKENYRFSLIQTLISFPIMLALLYFGVFGWLDEQLRTLTEHPVLLALLFFGVLGIISDISTLPFQWYKTFVIEEKFGFNKTTVKTFWIDKLKSYLLGIILGSLVLGALIFLIQWLGQSFWIWFWIFISSFTLLMNIFYTSLIMPLFNKLTPLEEGPLRTAIEGYSEKVKFPLDNVFVIDGSKRSSRANAFFSGLGKQKKVVLYDTLIEQHEEEELLAVLAHEVGHFKKKHIIQSLVLSIAQSGLMLFILSFFVFSESFTAAMGGSASVIHLNLMAFALLYSPISLVIGLFMNLFSRKNEYEADRYAAETFKAQPLQDALVKLHQENLSNLTPHPLYVFFNYSHPTLLQRLKALGA
ncbi:MAG: M48 family metallopeptidase [Bacteroidia bacterium]|nr:M48 family metallopeptidase [Bacteroidia bacterium]